jgi:LPXTG-motif cell wall-anchored protein
MMVRHYQYSGGTVTGINYDEYWLRAIKNPYASDYCYADDAIFYSDFTDEELTEYFRKIIVSSQQIDYGIILKNGTDLVITDPLGEGMKVVGDPTLIYNGTKIAASPLSTSYGNDSDEYGSYTEYSWTVTTPARAGADKKGTQSGTVKARVYTSADKTTQVVQFIIPENLLPALYPDRYQEFYYEELPVRLVYKVGIDVDSDAYQNAANGSALYTNLYDDTNGADGDATAYTTFYPDSTNPYYVLYDYDDENFGEEPFMANYVISKNTYDDDDNVISTTNVTETATNVFEEDVNYVEDEEKNAEDWDEIEVIQHLGNNGKVILSQQAGKTLTVTKQWASGTDSEPISVTLYASGTRQKTGETTTTKGVWEIDTQTITSTDKWTYTWSDLPESETKDGYIYTYTDYYILESSESVYSVTYQDSSGNTLTPKTITVTEGDTTQEVSAVPVDGSKITIINKPAYVLPNSGGVGTQVYTWSGMATLTIAIALYALIRRRQRNRGRGGEVS